MDGSVEALVDNYNNKLLNGPNDLWIDTKGGIYFSDPYYKRSYWTRTGMEQDGQCVYYLSSDRKNLTRAAEGFVRPNGVVGNKEGTKLYIADIGDNKTYSYQISVDGTLTDKKLFAEFGSDGMTIDEYGNVVGLVSLEDVIEEIVGEIRDEHENIRSEVIPLEKGGWFIDAGMLGFVNLMEEVYGWDLAELNQRISDNKDLVYKYLHF